MSTADHLGDLLSAYLDGELDGDATRTVESHLAGCCACDAELDDLAAGRRLLREAPQVRAPAGFLAGLVRRRRRASRRGATLALAVAMIAVVTGLSIADGSSRGADRRPALSLTGDPSRLGTAGAGEPLADSGSPGLGDLDRPMLASGEDGTDGPGGTPVTPGATEPDTPATDTTSPGNGTGPETASGPVTVGDRLDDLATNLLALIGG